MQATRTPASLRTAAKLLGAMLLVPLMTACPKGDVGAPCNHGNVDPPESKVVTFPALSCNDLLCIYADEKEPPADGCKTDDDCNKVEPGKQQFACNTSGVCKLSSTYVLERSMCSKTCETDTDCQDGGIGKKVLAKDSACELGFACVQIQKLGEFCCQKLCVCSDDLSAGTVEDYAKECNDMPQIDGKPACDDGMMAADTTATATATAGDTAATM